MGGFQTKVVVGAVQLVGIPGLVLAVVYLAYLMPATLATAMGWGQTWGRCGRNPGREVFLPCSGMTGG